ncbi:MAG: type II toxin-antitoxin system PemK/MazF family toxin [Oscillospiraceae bacterium]|nr:type II toxin-antitoxin system PemK/MazF family toxin [Oscillospiraceae bacterium]
MLDTVKRGDIYYADLSPARGSEQDGVRPVLIISNDTGNKYAPTVVAAAITGADKRPLPTHVDLTGFVVLPSQSCVLLEQLRTLDKSRLRQYCGCLDEKCMASVENAIAVSLGMC